MRSSDKTLGDLRDDVSKQEADMSVLVEQWTSLEDDLVQQIAAIKSKLATRSAATIMAKKELDDLKKELSAKSKLVKEREQLANDLNSKMPDTLPPGRSSYTKRILEIVNNVKKQNQETRKVLSDTRTVQKEINTLQGKVSRAFVVADETIFRDAKSSEWNRKCYKLLAAMRESCDLIMSELEDMGTIKRETIKLEEQLDKEDTKLVASNLNRIKADLKEIQFENQKLTNMKTAMAKQQQQIS